MTRSSRGNSQLVSVRNFFLPKSNSPVVSFSSIPSSPVLRLRPTVDGPRWSGIVIRVTDEP